MKLLEIKTEATCCKKIQHSARNFGKTHTTICNKPATHIHNNIHYFCLRHSKLQRFVVRNGDVGKILARFDTEQELRSNIHLFPNMRMQKISKSHRKDIY